MTTALSKILSTACLNTSAIGLLYISASVFQIGWICLVVVNYEKALMFIDLPVLGWVFMTIWVTMLWVIFHLLFIGWKLVKIGSGPGATITQTADQKTRQKNVTILLVLGIILDIILIPLLIATEDKTVVVFLTGVMGGRVVQANLEAVLQYHQV